MAKRLGMLTVGGDAPGQNVCLKSLIYSATDRGYDVIGIRKGWEGLLHYNPDDPATRGDNVMPLAREFTPNSKTDRVIVKRSFVFGS